MLEKNVIKIQVIVAIIITCIIQFVFIYQKQGWHEDEIFSYGSSNYKYDNMFQTFSDRDSFNQLVGEKIIGSNIFNTINNISYYLKHNNEFSTILKEKEQNQTPVWKTPKQAKEYLTLSKDEIFNYGSVYYNQSRDVHPPLFYILVHFASSFSLDHFSKYIIFLINIVFHIGICIIIYKIMNLFDKEKYSAISILLYGCCTGTISIIMFQRMYVMLTFFCLTYFYLHIKLIKNNFVISKKTNNLLTAVIILGFLTHYYFCLYVAFVFLIMIFYLIKNKKEIILNYFLIHLKSAILGILLFPASIYHIFFSYRGVGSGFIETSYLFRLKEYILLIFNSFPVSKFFGYLCIIILIKFLISNYKKTSINFYLFIFPLLFYFASIIKIAPYIHIRYIAIIFPFISIGITILIFNFINKKIGNKVVMLISLFIIILSSINLSYNKPQFLYTEYKKRIEIAEKYSNLKLVYIGEYDFVYLKDIEEFLRYKNSLLLKTHDVELLKDNEGLKNEKEFILNIKYQVSNIDNILEQVLEYTNAEDYIILLDDGESKIYKIVRKDDV